MSQPFDVAVGEHHDVTPSLGRLTGPQYTAFACIACVGIGVAVAIAVAARTGSNPVLLIPAAMIVLGVFWTAGEPVARWRRVYASAGRLDVVRPWGTVSYTRTRWDHDWDIPQGPRASFCLMLTLIHRTTGRRRRIAISRQDQPLLRRLWDQPTTAASIDPAARVR